MLGRTEALLPCCQSWLSGRQHGPFVLLFISVIAIHDHLHPVNCAGRMLARSSLLPRPSCTRGDKTQSTEDLGPLQPVMYLELIDTARLEQLLAIGHP